MCKQGTQTCALGSYPCGTAGSGPWCTSASYCSGYACTTFRVTSAAIGTPTTPTTTTGMIGCPVGTHLIACPDVYDCTNARVGTTCQLTVPGYKTGTPTAICAGDGP